MRLGAGEIVTILVAVALCAVVFTKGKTIPEIAENFKIGKDKLTKEDKATE